MSEEFSMYKLPVGWAWTSVGSLSLLINYGYTTSSTKQDTGVKFLRITDIQDYKVSWRNVPFCEIEESKIDKYSLGDGDIVFARTGATVGKSFLIQGLIPKAIFASYLIRLKLSQKILPKYLFYFFQSADYWRQIGLKATGIGQPNVNASSLSRIVLPLCSEVLQYGIVNKIDELFSELDNSIAQLNLVQNQLKVYQQVLLKQAFEGKLTEQWRKDNNPEPAEKLLELIKTDRINRYKKEVIDWKEAVDVWEKGGKRGKKPVKTKSPENLQVSSVERENLNILPTEWSITKIANVSSVSTGITPLKSRIEFYKNGNIPWVTSGALNDWTVTQPSSYITETALKETNLKLFPKNTLLVALYGEGKTRGKCSELAIEATINQAIAAIVQAGKEERLRKILKFFMLKNYSEIRKLAGGGAQPNLNLKVIKNTVFPVPTEGELQLITDELESQFSIIENLSQTIETSIQKLNDLRQTILKKAFEGKLVEQEFIDETAALLLKRIQTEKRQYLEEQKKLKKNRPKRTKKMSKALSIQEVLKTSNKPMPAVQVWQESQYKDDIEEFYAELKRIQGSINEVKRGTESLLSLAK